MVYFSVYGHKKKHTCKICSRKQGHANPSQLVLQGAGYKLVTVAECLGQQPYLSTGPPAAVRFSSPFISNNTLIDIFCIRFVGHMVLLNIGLEHFAHHNTLYFLGLSAPFVMFLDVITKLDIWSNVNVLTCEMSAERLHQQTLEIAVAPEDHHSTPVASAGLQLV